MNTARPAGTAEAARSHPTPRQRRGVVRIGPWVSVPVRRSTLVAAAVALVLLCACAVATLTLGRLGIGLGELPSALMGEATGKDAFVLNRLRGPRLVVAVATGAAFGLSGALFQSVTRNPLGSPDVIGLGAGAGAGAAATALFLPDTLPVSVGALLGAVLAMALVYVSTGTGFRSPGRLVVAGIGVAAMATALTQYVVYAVERDKASALTAYINGSLAARSWDDAATIWTVLLVCLPLAALLARPLGIGEMGDDISTGLGSRPGRITTAAVLLSIVLSAGAVSVAGPIAFVSLTAPQIAKRVTRGGGPHLMMSTLLGALLLVLADLAAQQLPLFDNLPVGLYTMAVGGAYLGWLLVREWRRPAV
ncbi:MULTISPECIES: FecCD family ABC transporter permease [Streptomyces]|uniref:Iron chelate uptake ABC transporter family permease subunit n=2 Tax=Streptomyces TaxID=1883 RepID=A0ABU2RRL9_9ACTN|nr:MULTISPECIES: iron chelate uptake ABC transporter family permease subunit [unclassified Streptomyces]MDT0431484.1 iron chelate uptake ABC transporter family permease subunit [Streptomyces sp. DSM 41770]HBF79737.1 ferrichrome ABC transporter permease [Streptomyces sp.]